MAMHPKCVPLCSTFLLLQDGKVDAEELQTCLTNLGIAGTFKPFSKETCIIMVNMLDDSGKLGYPEFTELLRCLQQWMVS